MKTTNETTTKKAVKSPAKSATVKAKAGAAKDLRDLFIDGLKDIYWAEKALTKAIPKMVRNAMNSSLIEALQSHLEQTKDQVTKVEEVFAAIDEKATAKKCVAMEGLIKEAEEIMEETEDGVVRDAGIIAAAQKVEHYEIATYGTLATFAKTLGENDAAAILEEILLEEREADETLSQLAEASINSHAKKNGKK